MNKILKYILIGFVGLIVLIFVFGDSDSDKAEDSIDKVAETEVVEQQEAQKVEIVSFINEFDENQLAAEAKYEDKLIEFNGYIDNISEDILGSPFLAINPSTDEYYFGTHIQCFFKEKADLISLKNGQKVTTQGIFSSQTLGGIIVKECKIVQ